MKTIKWTKQETELAKLWLTLESVEEVAKRMAKAWSRKERGFDERRSANAIRRKALRENWKMLGCPVTTTTTKAVTDDPNWETLHQIIEKHKTACVQNTRGINVEAGRKILSISDIHFPLADENHLKRIVREHADADIVVLNGDILEGYAFSTFEKNKAIAALDEYRAAFDFIKFVSDHFPKVVLVDGNHDVRASRAVKSVFDKNASSILRPNLIARLANGERLDNTGKLIEKLKFDNVYYEENESWYVRIGHTLFIHPHGSSSGGPGGMVRKHATRFNLRYDSGEIDSIVCGHTHQVYKSIINNQLLIEQGCTASFLSYSWTPKAEYITNAQQGYAVIYQDKDGNTDFNKSGPIYLGEVLPPKKSIVL